MIKKAPALSLNAAKHIESVSDALQDKPRSFEADEVTWFTVERGEVTLLLKEKPPLTIYTWIWMTDDREGRLRWVTWFSYYDDDAAAAQSVMSESVK